VSVTSTEICCLALHRCGGDVDPIDTEDIAIEANELVPGRFVWKKYPEQINLESMRRVLSSAKTEHLLVTGSASKGWMLTPQGLKLALQLMEDEEKLKQGVTTRPLITRDEKWTHSERLRLLATDLAKQLNDDPNADVSKRTLQAFFRITPYGSELDIQRKIDRYVNTLGKDETVGDLILTAKDRWYKLTSKEID